MVKSILIVSLFSSTVFAALTPNPQMKKVLDKLDEKGARPVEHLSVEEAREQPSAPEAVKAIAPKPKDNLAEVKDIKIQGADGKLKARLYRPKGKGPFPVVVYYHGGGWVLSDIDTYDATPRSLAAKTNAIFIAVEYRRAPEDRFPAAHDDAFAAYQWVLKNAMTFDGDPKKIAVAGESTGGNLALNVAIMARDQSLQIPIHELLIYPVASTKMNTSSYKINGDAKPLNKAKMNWYFSKYLRSPQDKEDPRIDLLKASFRGLSPATIITAEIDPLQVEGRELAEKMERQGVEVTYRNYEGVTHEFFGMTGVLKEAQEAQNEASLKLQKSFGK
ncbi:alpha/beta hydrolase [Peredibacter starrii]|uniref:Alpha/beta hydrolase n=1 Tax=Peredibacter starrii TaxID=28202 RepID=A0AAX4HLL3_9BACT|nr:alpha/beta hydrolase [Peredibacter starrii]WPU64154.1 alpha/beta hydrolase [Peredibacter starrii]